MRRIDHEGAAFHHESAAHHHRQASEHRAKGEHERAERHEVTAESHARRAQAYAQSALPDTDQNAVYGRGDGGYDDGGFRRGARDNDRHYGMRHDASRAIADPTDGKIDETRSERDRRARPQGADVEDRGREARAR